MRLQIRLSSCEYHSEQIGSRNPKGSPRSLCLPVCRWHFRRWSLCERLRRCRLVLICLFVCSAQRSARWRRGSFRKRRTAGARGAAVWRRPHTKEGAGPGRRGMKWTWRTRPAHGCRQRKASALPWRRANPLPPRFPLGPITRANPPLRHTTVPVRLSQAPGAGIGIYTHSHARRWRVAA